MGNQAEVTQRAQGTRGIQGDDLNVFLSAPCALCETPFPIKKPLLLSNGSYIIW